MGIVGTLAVAFAPAGAYLLFRHRYPIWRKVGKFLAFWYLILFLTPVMQLGAAAYSAYHKVHSTPRISPIFPPSIQRWENDIAQWSTDYDLRPNLIATVMLLESCGDPLAVSSAGAIGLFQVMPFHFADWEMRQHPEVNAYRGLSYLKERLNAAGGDVESALAQYNGGPAAANPDRRADETKRYVAYGWPIYQDAELGLSSSLKLNDWLIRYGSACQTAQERPRNAASFCLIQPMSQYRIVVPYRSPASLTQHLHGCADGAPGVDFATRSNDLAVISPLSGVVTANYTDNVGNTVLVIESGELRVTMLHGHWTPLVDALIDQGDIVGTQGNEGYSFGAHTHLMVWDKVANGWVNPLALMR